MTLKQIADSVRDFNIQELSLDKPLTKEIQTRLIDLSILDPPADGDFGPVSKSALEKFVRLKNIPVSDFVSSRIATALLETNVDTLFPLALDNSLASKLIEYLQAKNFWFSRLPNYLTIVYVEGMNADGSLNDNKPNVFNDRRFLLSFEANTPRLVGTWEGTTEPSAFYTRHPLNPKGAARIAFGQYKAWRVGKHPRSAGGGGHEALVQVDTVRVFRDLNQDFKRTGDATDVGSSFGVNQHWGFDFRKEDIGKASAGCLVGRTKDGHREFMKLLKTDPRFTASRGYKFMATVIEGADFKATMG
ncbi:MAG: peptidoglycan-binding protein [Cytophagaceae bacterium]|nr:peptidoglycan-binding protein [Cytophagaceae bacterium]